MKNPFSILPLTILLLIACKKEGPDKPNPVHIGSHGIADLHFRDHSYEFDHLDHTYALIISGTLDNKDYLVLFFDSVNTEDTGRVNLMIEDVSGSFRNSHSIYAKYYLIGQDAFEDYVSLDSLNDEKAFYTLQLNMADTAYADPPDTLWITGTMEIKLPQVVF